MTSHQLPQSSLMTLSMLAMKAGMILKWRVAAGDVRVRLTGGKFDKGWLTAIGTRSLDETIETLAAAVLRDLLPNRVFAGEQLRIAA